jgi:plastocyanin
MSSLAGFSLMGTKLALTHGDSMGAHVPERSKRHQSGYKLMKAYNLLRHLGRLALFGLAAWALAWPLPAQAIITTNVDVTDVGTDFGAFVPDAVTINVGDQVNWIWTGTMPHSSTSTHTPAVWDSGIKMKPASFSFTFNSSGSYPYICVVHGFTGSVTVQAAGVPPSVAITSPTNGTTFAAPWTGTIHATVSDSNATVSKVDFFASGTRLGTVTNPPVNPSFTVTNLAAGNYTLTAVATDSLGLTNTPVGVGISVVTPVAIVLSSPQRLSATSFQFSYTANPGLSYIVLRSASLPGLSPINTNTATSGTVTFLDTNATGDLNFYGVHLAPNP